LIVEQEVGPRVTPLIVVVVVAEPVGVAIVDEAGFFPCFETIISRITANLTRHVCIPDHGGFFVGLCLQFFHVEVHLRGDHVDPINLVYTAGTGLETISIPTLICHHLLD
jgi:hypothetical protein